MAPLHTDEGECYVTLIGAGDIPEATSAPKAAPVVKAFSFVAIPHAENQPCTPKPQTSETNALQTSKPRKLLPTSLKLNKNRMGI